LISIIQQYGREAPAVRREWAEELEALGADLGEFEPAALESRGRAN